MNPQYDKSLDFLQKFRPKGPWTLTSIDPSKKGIETRTFREETKDALLNWLQEQGATRNIYYSVNEAKTDISKKADKEDIKEVSWFHVDIDPRANEDPEEERDRILKKLRTPPMGVPPPTVIIFSGGGYNALWSLSSAIPVNGDIELAEEAERFNQQIELLLEADHCHNVDRILRLPGTINRPDEKKKKRGRTEALSSVVEWHQDRVYEIGKFSKAVQTQKGRETGPNNIITITGEIPKFMSVEDLPESVPNRTKVIIVQGKDPDNPGKHPSRSEWLFGVVCELVRAGMKDEEIVGVIMSPSFGISASVLDKGGNAKKYAISQVERARERAIDPDLAKFNERFAVIGNWGGKCRVLEELYDPAMKRPRVTKQSFEDFRNRFLNDRKEVPTAKGETSYIPLGHWWLFHKNRRQYDTLVFAPGKDVPGAYNLWRGFACDAKPGDCSLFLNHLKENLCRNDEQLYAYLVGWMASVVQKPDSPGYSAVVLRGGQGTGKSIVAKNFGSLFGRHFMQVTDPKHLVGSFNYHLRDCVFLLSEEAFYAGDKKHESVLKMLITEELITIEAKGIDAEASANCVHLMMTSNEQWVVPAGLDDRRFFVLDVSDSKKGDHAYFGAMQKQMDSGGREALLHFLMNYPLSGFNVRNVPKTEALQQQKVLSFGPEEEWWYAKLMEGKLLSEHAGWKKEICTAELLGDYVQYSRRYGAIRRTNATRLGHSLRKFCPTMPDPVQKRNPHTIRGQGDPIIVQRPYFYQIPPLEEARRIWDENFGGPYKWPKIEKHEEDDNADADPPF